MKNLLSLIAVLSSFTWMVGYFFYHQGHFIHIFLGAAIVAVLVRILYSGTIVLK